MFKCRTPLKEYSSSSTFTEVWYASRGSNCFLCQPVVAARLEARKSGAQLGGGHFHFMPCGVERLQGSTPAPQTTYGHVENETSKLKETLLSAPRLGTVCTAPIFFFSLGCKLNHSVKSGSPKLCLWSNLHVQVCASITISSTQRLEFIWLPPISLR